MKSNYNVGKGLVGQYYYKIQGSYFCIRDVKNTDYQNRDS